MKIEKSRLLRKIGIVGDTLAPYFNEACANQMRLLSRRLNSPVLTCSDLSVIPFKRIDNYFIVNGKFLREDSRKPLLSFLNGAFFYPFLKWFERKHDIVILSGGVNSGFLRYLALEKCVLVMNSLPFAKESKNTREFTRKFAPKLKRIIAQSKRIRDRLLEMGVEAQKIHVIYPWIDLSKFKPIDPPPFDEFRILFASAPNAEILGENIFEEKGIPLLLEAFKEFSKEHKAKLRLLWRGYYNDVLKSKIKEMELEGKVKIINKVVDTAKLFSESHITVIPFITTRRSPEIPLSGVESLACGRPVVATNVMEIAELIRTYKCGSISKPDKTSLREALNECKVNYAVYQANCRNVAERYFAFNADKLAEFTECCK